jgi:two-component system, response regulator PdtaR
MKPTEINRAADPQSLIFGAEMSHATDTAKALARASLAELEGKPMKALRILVVEDDAMIGVLLAETLEDLGHVVCAVETDAANAVAAAARHHPDVMIVDVGLGEASGVAVVKEILLSGFVPHVFATGDALRDLSLGSEAVLIQKPFRGPDILRAIERALATKGGHIDVAPVAA